MRTISKKRFCLLITVLISLLLSIGIVAATGATFSPQTFYEANTIPFTIDISNLYSSKIINEIETTLPDFTITAVQQFTGWSENHTAVHVEWRDGSIEGNVKSALFMFNATVPVVSADDARNISIDTRFTDGTDITFVVPILITNDVTGPVITNTNPSDGGYLRANNPSQLIHANVVDPETGVSSVSFSWDDCGSNSSNNQENLDCEGDDCNSTIDVSNYDEGDNLCFTFTATNKGGEQSQLSGTVGFDGTAPTVALSSPADDAYLGTNADFSFTATDNLASVLSCDLLVDGDVVSTVDVNNSETATVSMDFSSYSEGTYQWKVRCRDSVGLEGESGTRNFILDNTPPSLELISPANGSTISDSTIFNVNVTDNYGVAQVSSNPNVNDIVSWPEGSNTVIFQATDHVGNSVTKIYTFIVDRTAPSILLISPADGATLDAHVDFVFNLTDNYATNLDCTVYVDGSAEVSETVSQGTVDILGLLALGNHTWHIVCEDEVNNAASSAQRTINIIDTSGPDILLTDVIEVERGTDFTIEATVTDPSGVATVTGQFGSTTFNMDKNGDVYTKTVSTNSGSVLGNYTYTVTATDTNGYSSSEQDTFELVPYTGTSSSSSGSGGGSNTGGNTGHGFMTHSSSQPQPVYSDAQESESSGGENQQVEEESEPEEEPPVEDDVDEQSDLEETQGIGKATSFFSSGLFKFAGLFVLLVIVLSLFALGFSKFPKLKFKRKEEEKIKKDMEKEAFFNEKLKKDLSNDFGSAEEKSENIAEPRNEHNFLFDDEE